MSDFDNPWKEALEEFFEPFLAFVFNDVHAAIDWNRSFEWLDKELMQIVPDAEQGKRFVDKLVKVWLRDGTENWILIHIEVQSQIDESFAERMYVYNYRVFDRYNRRVASLAILGDDQPGWRPDRFGYELLGCKVELRFRTVKLLDYAGRIAELERDENPFALLVLAHLKTLETRNAVADRLQYKTRIVRVLLEHGWASDRVMRVFRIVDWLMDLPDEQSRIFWKDVTQLQQEKKMPFITTPERIGREEGRKEGEKEGLRRAVRLELEQRFGDSARPVIAALESVQSGEALFEALRQLVAGESLDTVRSLFETP